jgi:hypothetical protein
MVHTHEHRFDIACVAHIGLGAAPRRRVRVNNKRSIFSSRERCNDVTMMNDDDHPRQKPKSKGISTRSHFWAMGRLQRSKTDFASLAEDEKAIVFGDVRHIENHEGTKFFSRRIGTYASQYDHTFTKGVGAAIYSEFSRKGYDFWIPDTGGKDGDVYRRAVKEEIMSRIETLFDEGGGKTSKRRKKNKNSQRSGSSDDPNAPPFKAGDSIYAFEQLYRATVREIEQNLDGEYTIKVHWKGFRKENDCDISHLQILPVNTKTTQLYETIDKSERTGDHDSDTEDYEPRVLNHRLFQEGSTKRPRISSPSSVTGAVTTSASIIVSPPPQNTNNTVPPLAQTIKRAKKKCDKVINTAQSSDIPSQWKDGNVADWTKGTILSSIEEHVIPFTEELEQEHQALVSKGLPKMFDASVTKAKLEQLKKVQKHLTALIKDLTEDDC